MTLDIHVRGRLPALLLLTFLLAACGSTATSVPPGAGGDPTAPSGPPAARETGTARFDVNVDTGAVQVTPLTAEADSRAVLNGSAVSFTSSVLLDQPGSSGLRVLNVRLTNRLGTPIGRDNLRVVLSHLTTGNNPTAELRKQVQVSGTSIGLTGLRGLSFAPDGSYLVARVVDHRIHRVQNNRATVFTGRATPGYQDGAPDAAQFNQPNDVLYHAGHDAYYVADTGNHRIRRIDHNGRVSTVAGTGAAGATNGPGNTATFDAPQMLDVDRNGALVVTTADGRVRRITLGSGNATLPASYTVATLASGLTAPAGIAAAPDGNLYVAERTAHRIRLIAASGSRVVIAGTGTAGQQDGAGNVATLRSPVGLAWVRGALVVADSSGHKIRLITLAPGTQASRADNWNVINLAGAHDGTAGNSVGQGNASRFNAPWGLRGREDGSVIFTDVQNNAVRRLNLPDGAQTTGVGSSVASEPVQVANASGRYSQPSDSVPYFDYPLSAASLAHGAATAPQEWWFNVPDGVRSFSFIATVEAATTGAASPEGRPQATNQRIRVQTVVRISALGPNVSTSALDGPGPHSTMSATTNGLAVDPQGVVYMTSYGTVRRYDPATNELSTIAGHPHATVQDGSTGDTVRFSVPRGIAAPRPGVVYFADYGQHAIFLLTHTGGSPTEAANWAVHPIIKNGQGIPDGTATSPIYRPQGLAAASDRVIWFTDEGNRVCRTACSGSDITKPANWRTVVVAGDTSALAPPNGATDYPARFANPRGIVVGLDGSAYVADRQNNKIRRVTEDGVTATFAGPHAGQTPLGYVDGAATTARFQWPIGLAIDAAGNLYSREIVGMRRISTNGQVSTVLASSNTPKDGFGTEASLLNLPTSELQAMAVGPDGDIWFFDALGLRRISRVLSAGAP